MPNLAQAANLEKKKVCCRKEGGNGLLFHSITSCSKAPFGFHIFSPSVGLSSYIVTAAKIVVNS